MATAAVIDIDALIQPFSDENPAGEDIREDYSPTSIYYQIKDARAAARTAERQNLMNDDPEAINFIVPEWNDVIRLAPQILAEHGKDFEITAWYVEALLREHGFAGLRDGFKLSIALVEKYWDGMYPMPDEDGLETRVAPVTGLNGVDGDGTLIGPIKQVNLTEGYSESPFAAWHYEQAYEIEMISDPDKKEARVSSGAVTMSLIDQSILETSPGFFAELLDDLDACIEAYSTLSTLLDEKCGNESPPSSNIRNSLKRVREILGFMTKNVIFATASTDEDSANEANGNAESGNSSAQGGGSGKSVSIDSVTIKNRDEAFRALLKVSEFFRRTEPHSPISYNLEQAVKWGGMALPELLGELIPDDNAREEFFKLAGIPEKD